jgi:hypothetical protein
LKWRKTWELESIPLPLKREIATEVRRIDGAKGGRPQLNDPATEQRRAWGREAQARLRNRKKTEKDKTP